MNYQSVKEVDVSSSTDSSAISSRLSVDNMLSSKEDLFTTVPSSGSTHAALTISGSAGLPINGGIFLNFSQINPYHRRFLLEWVKSLQQSHCYLQNVRGIYRLIQKYWLELWN